MGKSEMRGNDGINYIHESLKKCPFCGNIPDIFMIGNGHSKKRSIIIKCKTCLVLREVGAIHKDTQWLVEEAVKQWNNRI